MRLAFLAGACRRLHKAIEERIEAGKFSITAVMEDARMEGAVLRVRPRAMTAAVILAVFFRARRLLTVVALLGRVCKAPR